MIRIGIIAIMAYAAGGEALESYRPAAVDQPLAMFHQTVDEAVVDALTVTGALAATIKTAARTYEEPVDHYRGALNDLIN